MFNQQPESMYAVYREPSAAVNHTIRGDASGFTRSCRESLSTPQRSVAPTELYAPLLRDLFKLRAEHIHGPVVVEVASQRDVKPVALFAFDDEFCKVGLARRALSG